MKKRVLAIILAVVMIISAVGVTSFVKGNTVTTTEDATAEAGSTVSPAEEKGEPTAEEEHDTILLTDTEDGISATSRLVASTGSKAEGSEYTPVGSQTAYVDENNALTVPYDVAYPEAFASEDCQYATDTILVKCKPGFNGKVSSAMKKAGIVSLEELFSVESGIWYSAGVSGDVQTVMAAVRQIEQVVVAEYNYIYESSAIVDTDSVIEDVQSNVQCFDQWHLRSGHLQNSWSYMKNQLHIVPGGDSSVVVAVIDTGVDYTHEDLKDNIWVNSKEIPDNGRDDDGNGYVDDYYGVNLETKKGSGMDDNGHGTHVAGIVAARNNNIGVVGVAYNVKVMPVKAGMASGYFNQAQVAAGIIYAYENGADVINMSFGGSASTIAVQDALETAYTRCVLVAAAGNDGWYNEYDAYHVDPPRPNYPAALAYVLGVMSVDSYGRESYFTSYDVVAYSSVEYEVYAPGSQILSTIPGNRYAAWSGTSMAAPYVSAVAALLRSAYPNRNTYPTKFIYGQIAATGEESAICYNPTVHGPHNLPKIVDVYNALTKLPKPEVSPADFVLFDDVSLSERNNGDGVIDAGETVAIGFTMRNRWGAAKDVTIHLDATNDIGLACPYITFPRNDVNYGQIGTYATQDYGKTRDGEFVTGLDTESSLLFTVAEDCPNDYIIQVYLTVSCRNDIDKNDHTLYVTDPQKRPYANLTVRRGVILPSVIDRDMTLTAENYYIIPNATTILAGATVTVEPGTQIQFWSDDPNDQYADTAIAYLRVEGTLLCQGTAENHIRMFPSERMDRYQVQLYEDNGGCIKLWYTDVVNPFVQKTDSANYGATNYGATYAYGCEFSQNYRATSMRYRYLDSGTVRVTYHAASVRADEIESCAFYKIGGLDSIYKAKIYGKCRDCIFVDSAVVLERAYNGTGYEDLTRDYEGCVFLGNNNYLGEKSGLLSAYPVVEMDPVTVRQILTDPESGTTYVALEFTNVAATLRLVAYLGGHLCCMETAEEQAFLQRYLDSRITNTYIDGKLVSFDSSRYLCGLQDAEDGTQRWITGSQAQVLLNEYAPMVRNVESACEYYWYGPHLDQFYGKYGSGRYLLAEFPDSTVTDILLPEDTIQMDTGMTYQLYPEVAPLRTAMVADLRYRSLDETVVTVNQSGLITPVAAGGTVVRVSSSDGSVYKDVAVHVADCAALTGLTLNETTLRLPVGESRKVTPIFTPAGTIRTDVTYTSSDETVATVDGDGTIRSIGVGTATITARPATGENLAASVTVNVVQPAESITFAEPLYVTGLQQPEDDLGLSILPEDTTERTVLWVSSNPEVCQMGEDGRLVKHQAGAATLRATLAGTERYAEVTVYVTNGASQTQVTEMQVNDNRYSALLDDGSLWYWGAGQSAAKQIVASGAISHTRARSNDQYYVLMADGIIDEYNLNGDKVTEDILADVAKLAGYGSAAFAIKTDGSVWSWGSNNYGMLGNGTDQDTPIPTSSLNLPGRAQSVVCNAFNSLVLLEDGRLYIAGDYIGNQFTLLQEDVSEVFIKDGSSFASRVGDSICHFHFNSGGLKLLKTDPALSDAVFFGPFQSFYIENGKVFGTGSNSAGQLGNNSTESASNYMEMQGITDAIRVFSFANNTFVQTAHGFYGMGQNSSGNLMGYAAGNALTPVRLPLGMEENQHDVLLESHNLAGGESPVLQENEIDLDYNEMLLPSSQLGGVALADGTGSSVGVYRHTELDHLVITPYNPLTDGETYTLTVPAGAVQSRNGSSNEAMTFTFTYRAPAAPGTNSLVLNNTTVTTALSTNTDLGDPAVLFDVAATFAGEELPIQWAVGDETVAGMDENGHLTARAAGVTTVTAAMEGTEMSATAVLRLTADDSVTVVKHTGSSGSHTVLYSDGALYQAEGNTATALYDNAADFQWDDGKLWVLADDGTLYCDGIEAENAAPTLRYTNLLTRSGETILVGETAITLTTDRALTAGNALASITDDQGNAWTGSIDGYKLTIATQELTAGRQYTVTIPADAVENHFGKGNETISLTFTYLSRLTDGAASLLEGDDRAVTVLASGSVSDDGAAADRAWTEERFNREYTEFQNKGYDTVFFGNVILNRFTDNNVEKWLRIQAPNASSYTRMGIGGNYWGTAGMSEAAAKLAIDKQIIDYNDYQDYADLIEGEYLTEMPETVWPVAARVGILNSAGEETDTIGRETVTFFVEFNTDMDTETPLQVRFGSSYPYADYEVDGQWVSSRRWEGSTSITTVVGNGRQYWSIAEGRSAKGWKVYKDWGRFSFTIDTTAALAMTMQGAADDNSITLTWEQDDFDTLAGYNVYRAEYEDGNYVKLNSSVIPAETKTFSDTNVTPGKVYYYNFTVVQTDLSESQPSGKISIRAKDTMAPSIYHDGVYQAFTGSNLVISATVKDNVQVARVTLFYREAEGQWHTADMTHINDKFSAIIPAAYLTTEGLEYYIEAFDGVNFTRKGTAESPYTVTVQQAIDRNSLGDVDGDGRISVLDALLVLQARNDLVNLNQEQFARADLDGNGELTAYEALRILQYANGSIGSVTA